MKLPWSKSTPEIEISQFWAWFASRAANFDASNPTDQAEIAKRLQKIDPGLVWGIRSGLASGPRTLEISPGGISALVQLVKRVVAQAPNIPGWSTVAFRQPMDDFKINVGASEVTPETVYWTGAPQPNGRTSLTLYIPFPDPNAKEPLIDIGFMVLDHSLGELVVMTKVGELDFLHYSLAPSGAKPLKELAAHLGRG